MSQAVRMRCPVCDGDDVEALTTLVSARVPNYRPAIAICRGCGFVTLDPQPTEHVYQRINRDWFTLAYSDDPDAGLGPEQGLKKAASMWRRIASYYPRLGRMLDVGAGKGWSVEFLKAKFPGLQAAIVDPMADIESDLWKRHGVEVVRCGLEKVWPDTLHNRFDLVIFRHTLEHLPNPRDTLERIATCLAPGGLAYVVVPNALCIRAGHPMRTDFFRPVHLHYFNRHTLTRLAARAGLKPIVIGDDGEIWGLFTTDPAADAAPVVNSYAEQRAYLTRRLREARLVDGKMILKIRARELIPESILLWRRKHRKAPAGG